MSTPSSGRGRGAGGKGGGRGAGGKGGARRSVPGTARQRPTRRQQAQSAKAPAPQADVHDEHGVRLQKLLAQAGVASRRASEELIAGGRVTVDGETVRELGIRVDPATRAIAVDGMRIQLDTEKVYLALNKPRGVVSTMEDPEGRPCVGDLFQGRRERLFHVGRLDTDTEGLLLLTNDGDFSHRMQHPRYEVPKTYLAQVPGPIPRGLGRQLRDGVQLDDGPVKVDSFRLIDSAPGKALVEIVIHEGRNHIVRRMLAAVGHPVESLVRVQVGPVLLGDLLPGRNRPLTAEELGTLLSELQL